MHITVFSYGVHRVVLLLVGVQCTTAMISRGELPQGIKDCYKSYGKYSLRDVVGQTVSWHCESSPVSGLPKDDNSQDWSPSAKQYIEQIMKKLNESIHVGRVKRQAWRRCLRKEYRMLTDEERDRFHNAVNNLKRDTTVFPNRYDVIARLHTGIERLMHAHFGPNFFSWHRAYLIIFEISLQWVDPRVCLPYWDSSLDNELATPGNSYVFSPAFLGGRGYTGPLIDGPFRGWETPNNGPLARTVGVSGQLFDIRDINTVLSQRRMSQIVFDQDAPGNNNVLENHHGPIHIFVGGQMSNLITAAYDPAFFLHHCFVDYIWEEFRNRQRLVGIDPQTDYPQTGSPSHHPFEIMNISIPGYIQWSLTNREGYWNHMTNLYEYEASPTCIFGNQSCGSVYLECNSERRCVPVDRTPTRVVRSAVPVLNDPVTGDGLPPNSKLLPSIQNTFNIDGQCDIREWVYFPVEVVSVRSPDIYTYPSYPFYNGSIWRHRDVYDSSAYLSTSKFIAKGHPKYYNKCRHGNGVGEIFIQSTGLNYNGVYKESVIIDQRPATSIALSYIAVKNPVKGPVKALFRAYDSCGRICNTAFKIPGTRRYEAFSGVLDLEDVPGRRKQYSQNYGEAVLNTWGYSNNQECPSFEDDDIVLTFYCDYNENLPWGNSIIYSNNNLPVTPNQPSGPNRCTIDHECTIDVPCTTANKCVGERYKCHGSCNMYAECHSGHYFKKRCPFNWAYDTWSNQCIYTRLCWT